MTDEQRSIVANYQRSAPIDITALANALGLSVYDDPTMEPGVSGMICRDESEESSAGFAISVNANEPYSRRRFTIAHECAHFLKHRDKIGDGIQDDPMYRSDRMNNRQEDEANNTAADLLMPRRLISNFVRQGIVHPADLAKQFQVSEAAMRVRMRYLYHSL